MAAPRTLLQMSNAPFPDLSAAALVVIDAQGEYRDGALPLWRFEESVGAVAALLDLARRHGRPVLHVAHRGAKGGLFDPEGPGGQIVPEAAPRPGEPVIGKRLPNAFAGTELQAHLAGSGARTLIVAGFMTHMCVSATVRSALDHGYASLVIAQACSTRDLPDGAGGAVPAEALHRAELAALADRFAWVLPDAGALADRMPAA